MEKSKHNQLATKRLLLITYEENFSVDFLVFPELAVIKILEEKKKLSRTSQEKTAIAIKRVATLLHWNWFKEQGAFQVSNNYNLATFFFFHFFLIIG